MKTAIGEVFAALDALGRSDAFGQTPLAAARSVTDVQRSVLQLEYSALTVAELRRRGSGRGFRPAHLNSLRKQQIINAFIDEYGWGERLFGDGWEDRYWSAFVARNG